MSKYSLSNLEYTADITRYYKKFCDLPGFVLLESTDRTHGRYDILSAWPYDTVTISRDMKHNPDVIQKLTDKIPAFISELDLPFQGGAIGFFSYDFACSEAGINMSPQAGLLSMPLIEMGLYDWAFIVDHLLRKVTVFSANTQNNTGMIVNEMIARWHSRLEKNSGFKLASPFAPLISKADYEASFYAIHADLRKGRCYQVNYTQPFNAGFTGDSWEIYEAVKTSNPVPYSAFLRYEKNDILCFSPERFITIDNGAFLVSPIKGTEKRVSNPKEDRELALKLQASPKNRAENIMIVDLLRNDLGKIAKPGSVVVKALCDIESYEAVHHLVSHIAAESLDNVTQLQAFASCFPGGSITGAPKREAMRVIAEHEPYARGVYCGSIGYISSHGRIDMNIAIRTITAADNTLHLAAGGALVMDSNCDDEYDECFTKMAGIFKGLY